MKIETIEVCGLCFKIRSLSNCQVVDEILMEMLESLHIRKLHFTTTENATVCSICVDKVQGAYNFKTTFLEKEKSLLLSTLTQPDTLDSENKKICRLCKDIVNESSSVILTTMLSEINAMEAFKSYLPEIDLETTQNPIICEPCQTSVINFSTFVFSHFDNTVNEEKNIQIMDFEENNQPETNIFGVNTDKKEIDIKENDLMEIKRESIVYNECKTAQSEVKEEEINRESIEYNDCKIAQCEIKDRSCKVEVKSETDSDTSFCEYGTVDIKVVNETVNVKKETKSEDEISHEETKDGFGGMNYEEYRLKNEEIDLKLEPEQPVSDGFATQVLWGKNQPNYQEMTNIDESDHKRAQTKHVNNQTNKKSNLEVDDAPIVHKCQYCNFRTKHKCILKIHMLSHTTANEVKMFNCHQCTFRTKYKLNLRKHTLIHQSNEGTEMYTCQQCTYQGTCQQDLQKHILSHTNESEVQIYACQRCDYRTNIKRNLKKHSISHLKIDESILHSCQLCSFQTKYKNSLNRHIQSHRSSSDVSRYSPVRKRKPKVLKIDDFKLT